MNIPFRCGTVCVIGRPNVGKSTLMNHLVGQKVSITSRKAQTTRHRVMGVLTETNVQFIFVDSPGFQTTHSNALNRVLNRTVGQVAMEADVALLVVEATEFGDADRAVLRLIPKEIPAILVINKIDRLKDKSRLLAFLATVSKERDFASIVPVSAKLGQQLEALKTEVAKYLPEAPAVFEADEITDKPERFMASEFIREKVFRLVGDELPYSVSVIIEKFEQEGNLRRIFAAIIVEKQSQKAILIGLKGEKLKQIGSEARQDMEKTFGGKVYLELWVRVKKGWADNDKMLRQYGYE